MPAEWTRQVDKLNSAKITSGYVEIDHPVLMAHQRQGSRQERENGGKEAGTLLDILAIAVENLGVRYQGMGGPMSQEDVIKTRRGSLPPRVFHGSCLAPRERMIYHHRGRIWQHG